MRSRCTGYGGQTMGRNAAASTHQAFTVDTSPVIGLSKQILDLFLQLRILSGSHGGGHCRRDKFARTCGSRRRIQDQVSTKQQGSAAGVKGVKTPALRARSR